MARIVLLSGMGGDARVFEQQLAAFPNAVCPRWIEPLSNETLASYGKRFAQQFDGEPCIVGGASFGGFVAAEMSRHLPAAALVLIGSVPAPSHLPPLVRALCPVAGVAKIAPFALLRPFTRPLLSAPDSLAAPVTKRIFEQTVAADPEFVRWACGAVLRWTENPLPIPCPIFHMHGSADRILPYRYTMPTHLVRGGGHVLSISQPRIVNDFLRSISDQIPLCRPRSA